MGRPRLDMGILILVVGIAAIIAVAVYFTVADQRARAECFASKGLVVAAEHGDGWSCVYR